MSYDVFFEMGQRRIAVGKQQLSIIGACNITFTGSGSQSHKSVEIQPSAPAVLCLSSAEACLMQLGTDKNRLVRYRHAARVTCQLALESCVIYTIKRSICLVAAGTAVWLGTPRLQMLTEKLWSHSVQVCEKGPMPAEASTSIEPAGRKIVNL